MIYTFKSKQCFNNERSYYGWAGDAIIGGVVEAKDENEAWEVFEKSLRDQNYNYEADDKNFKNNYWVQVLGQEDNPHPILLLYGSY